MGHISESLFLVYIINTIKFRKVSNSKETETGILWNIKV